MQREVRAPKLLEKNIYFSLSGKIKIINIKEYYRNEKQSNREGFNQGSKLEVISRILQQ